MNHIKAVQLHENRGFRELKSEEDDLMSSYMLIIEVFDQNNLGCKPS